MAKNQPQFDLTIIIVNYNGSFWLKKVLQSFEDHFLPKTKYQVKVVVVDNGSTEDLAIALSAYKKTPWLDVIYTQQNLGFSAGNNVALRSYLAVSRFVMLLNSDIEFLPDDSNLDRLILFLKKNPQVGVISPQLILSDGEIDLACHRGEPTPWAAFTYFSGLAKIFPGVKFFASYHRTYEDFSTRHPVDSVSGAAMIMPSNAVTAVGLLDERFFMYAEDLDWCRRFRAAGFEVIYDPEVKLIHHKNKSGLASKSKKTRQKINRYFWSTMVQYYDKHYPDSHYVFRFFLRTFIFIKTGGFQ